HTCSMTAASANSLFYRSSSTAMYNLEEDRGVTVFGGYRPGCWLTVIPASGLVLSPEASSGCTCSFPIRCSFALVRKPEREKSYTVFITPGATKPVKHLALNLGAPADMKADDGTVWFGYPGPKNDGSSDGHIHFPNYGVKFKLNEKIMAGMGYFSSDFRGVTVAGTDKPWLFTSGCVGLTEITIPLLDKDAAGNAKYTVRLGFKNDGIDSRVFDIKLQGKTVVEGFKIGKRRKGKATIKEFAGVGVEDDLLIELVSGTNNQTPDKAPIINFIEVVREETFSKLSE
ncbi:MAG: hypothetical protein KAS23_12015, partial [Anaerohalosphaera sp.]|nr:hypothetical protein [Anaerohalosphaera sp.]